MRNETAIELRRLRQALDRAEHRLAMSDIPGKVKEVDADKRTLRLMIGKTSDGQEILSPPIRWQESGAGGMKVHSQPAVGEQMTMRSTSGTVGAGSIAHPATYDKDHEAPSKSTNTSVLERDGVVIEFGDGKVKITGALEITGASVTHNGHNIGDSHVHTGVIHGGDLSGPPP